MADTLCELYLEYAPEFHAHTRFFELDSRLEVYKAYLEKYGFDEHFKALYNYDGIFNNVINSSLEIGLEGAVWDNVKDAGRAVWNFIKKVINAIRNFIGKAIKLIGKIITGIGNWISASKETNKNLKDNPQAARESDVKVFTVINLQQRIKIIDEFITIFEKEKTNPAPKDANDGWLKKAVNGFKNIKNTIFGKLSGLCRNESKEQLAKTTLNDAIHECPRVCENIVKRFNELKALLPYWEGEMKRLDAEADRVSKTDKKKAEALKAQSNEWNEKVKILSGILNYLEKTSSDAQRTSQERTKVCNANKHNDSLATPPGGGAIPLGPAKADTK